MNKFKKINIYVRHYDKNRINGDRPAWFDYEKIFRNLLVTLDSTCNLNVVFEGDFDKYFLKKYESQFKLRIIETKTPRVTSENANWSKSVAATTELMFNDSVPDDELYYILEDDYIHIPGWPKAALDAFNFLDENDYISLYNHADKYLCRARNRTDHWSMYKDLKSEIICTNYSHFRTVPNCGMSMIIPAKLFRRDYKDHWSIGKSDCQLCYDVNNEYKTKFWTPIPGYSSHIVNPWISPLINWEETLKRFN